MWLGERERGKRREEEEEARPPLRAAAETQPEENQFDGSPLVGVRLAIISEHAEEIIGCSGVPL